MRGKSTGTQAQPARLALDEIQRVLREQLPCLQLRYGVRELWLFGSHVRHEQRPRSDLDILVEFGDMPPSLFQFIALENELSALTGIKVDLVMRSSLKPHIGERILREIVPI
jgi:hypothetical protein